MNFKILILSMLSFLIINSEIVEEFEQYNFVLLINHNSEYLMATFPLTDLKKCHFPEGPLRANIPAIEDFEKIDAKTYEKLQKVSTKLSVFCIVDGFRYKNLNNEESITLKKCGFEVPGQSKLHYVFCLKEEIQNISGYIVLRNELVNLTEKEKADDNLAIDIDDPELELKAGTKIEEPELSFKTKIGNYCRLLAVVAYIQYLKIKDYFGLSSDLVKTEGLIKSKDSLSKFKPKYEVYSEDQSSERETESNE